MRTRERWVAEAADAYVSEYGLDRAQAEQVAFRLCVKHGLAADPIYAVIQDMDSPEPLINPDKE